MPDLIEFHPFSSKEVQYRKEITNLRKQVGEQSRKIQKMMECDHEQEKLAYRQRIEQLEKALSASDRKLTQVLEAQPVPEPKPNRPKRLKHPEQPTPVVRKERLL